ncbi:uncharacterized protein LOC125497880 [Beta vulgaris subsp. vulgaris]|uniref:uncharacterized protein LOC125497880 n=1 Tax=Beta vulgaris subsp. vulgaris TaxID=3555 RepID=UPI002036E55D|nr:uncharacterized protein LOC125497880 [Beta vulgaris subsp. vulgaris]
MEFFDNGFMHKPVNCTAVTMIPKIDDAQYARDYRPIACCSTLYKIISKILTKRLQAVITKVVDSAQTGFIPERNIGDNILLATELIRGYSRRHISPRCVIKVDIRKAYDSVEWVFCESVWVICVMILILISIPNVRETHLMFADDLLTLARADASSITKIMKAFNLFSKASGLQASIEKSCIYFGGVCQDKASQMAENIQMPIGTLPFRYLRVPLAAKKLNFSQCKPLIDKITARAQGWIAHLLSYAGRLQLVKSILSRWVNAYYIKRQRLENVTVSSNTSWLLRKILEARELLVRIGGWEAVSTQWKFSIKKAYKLLQDDYDNMRNAKFFRDSDVNPNQIVRNIIFRIAVRCSEKQKQMLVM